MALQLTLNERNGKDLERIASIPVEKWERINKRFRKEKPLPLRKSQLLALVKDDLSEDDRDVLVRQLLGMGKLSREFDASIDEVISALDQAVEEADWSGERREKWNATKDSLAEALSSDAVHAVVKAVDLALDHQRILRTAKIITDIRPIFNDDRERFLGAVVHSLLRIKYYEGDSTADLTFVMSENDIRNLLSTCELALKKAEKARRLLDADCGIQTFSLDEEFENES
jgi:hypothetical protein